MRLSDVGSLAEPASELRCPHCASTLGAEATVGPVRCGECRLIVGAGRAVPDAQKTGRPGVGSASGHVASHARRTEADAVEPEKILAALRETASSLGVRVDTLRMIDYRRAVHAGRGGPSLPEVMAAFGGWKAARDAAAQS